MNRPSRPLITPHEPSDSSYSIYIYDLHGLILLTRPRSTGRTEPQPWSASGNGRCPADPPTAATTAQHQLRVSSGLTIGNLRALFSRPHTHDGRTHILFLADLISPTPLPPTRTIDRQWIGEAHLLGTAVTHPELYSARLLQDLRTMTTVLPTNSHPQRHQPQPIAEEQARRPE